MHVLFKHFLHVYFGWLRLQGMNRSQRVLNSSITVILRDGLVHDVGLGFLQLNGDLGHAQNLSIPLLGKVVTIVYKTISSEDYYMSAANQVLRSIVFFFPE